MLDAFAKVVAQADTRGEYVSDSQIDALNAMVGDGLKRIDTVNRITGSASSIVASAARALFAEQPQLIAPGGNAYTNRRMAACLRDMEIILRYVTYAIFTGDASILDDRCLNGLKETYAALGVPTTSTVRAVQIMKAQAAAHIKDTPSEARAGAKLRRMGSPVVEDRCASLVAEAGSYFDRVISALS